MGAPTTTYAGGGERGPPPLGPATLDRAAIEAALPDFVGDIMQAPPRYSALKRDGQRLYDLARAGVEFTTEPRPVRIDAIRVVSWLAPTLVIDVECGKGTYIRSLAHDLGERLGSGAHLAALDRTRVGPFTRRHSLTLDALAQAIASGAWSDYLYAPDEALLDLRAAILAPASETRMRHGQPLRWQPSPAGSAAAGPLRAYASDGRFLGVLTRAAADEWHPAKVLDVAPLE